MARQKFITKEITDKIPALKAQDSKGEDAIVYAKWFCPWSNWFWFATEMDQDTNEFFGLVYGFECELGYFTAEELQSVSGPGGLYIERDTHFTPKPLSEVREEMGKRLGLT